MIFAVAKFTVKGVDADSSSWHDHNKDEAAKMIK